MDAVANHCRVGVDDRLLIRWPAPLPDGRRVVLRHRASGGTLEEPVGDDGTSIEFSVGGLDPGKWQVRLVAGRTDVPLLTDDPCFSFDETRAYAGSPRDRAVRVVRSPEGEVSLRVRQVSPHAEVEAVYPREGEIRIEGRLAYAGPRPGEEARLTAVARETRRTMTRAARLDGTAFHVCLPVAAFAAEEPALWDLWLDADDVHARLATRLDDAPGKRGMVSFPRQLAPAGDADGETGGRQMSVRPYYTAKDQLAIASHLVTEEAG